MFTAFCISSDTHLLYSMLVPLHVDGFVKVPLESKFMSAPARFNRFLLLLFLLVLLIVPIGGIVSASGDNNIHWNELGFNSRDPLYRSPVGAVPVGTAVRVRLKALDGDLTSAQVRIWNDRIDGETLVDMSIVASNVTFPGDPNAYEFWEATLPAPALPTVYWYRFIVKDGSATAYYEDDGARDQGWGQTFGGSPDNSYQMTFYDPAFQTPDWVKDAVIYQVFVDRFRDGNSANNTPAGTFFYGANDSIYRSNGTDWNTRVCDPRSAAGSASICANMYSQNFYGGDLQGIIDQLNYLDNLGVTALYLNPIFESPSNHKYDTTNYYQIDDNFGDLALFQTLVAQADARGIRIILDGVFNHTSSDSLYFDRYSRWDAAGGSTVTGTNDGSGACESTSSPFASWFYFNAGTGCSDGRGYESWFGFDSLPKVNGANAAVRELFIDDNSAVDGDPLAIARYWMQWADGWRLDVGGDLDQGSINSPNNDYWEDFRAAVLATNPEAYIVGEEWGNATSWTIDNQWDATMNYQYSSAFLSFFRDETFVDNDHNVNSSAGVLAPLTPTQFSNRIENWEERYAPEAFYAMMNLLGSHDTNRPLFMLDHETDTATTATYNNPGYDWQTPIQRMLGVVLLQMTMPGAPTIYYGDEVAAVGPPAWDGSQWQDDPYNRVPYPWLDQTGTPYYAHMSSSIAQNAMRQYYTLLTTTRNAHPALRTGSYEPLYLNDADDVIAYLRMMPDDSDYAVVIANGSASARTANVDVSGHIPFGAVMVDVLTNTNYTVSGSGILSVPVQARLGALLVPAPTTPAFERPSASTDLMATPAPGQASLDWTNQVQGDFYDVYRSRLSGGGYALVGTTSDTFYTDSGLANGVRYYYIVVARNSEGLEGDWSNEVTVVPGYNLGGGSVWFNLQWPPEINHVLDLNNPTPTIYGQIWIGGATDAQNTPVAGIRAQVGYGPEADDPSLASWTWFEMEHNPTYNFSNNNDEFQGTMLPTEVGVFKFTTRYSADNGATWYYTDRGAPPYDVADAGTLTVTASSDTTPPAAPTNLQVLATTSTSATLGWDAHPNADGDLAGFEIWRETAAGSPLSEAVFTKIGTVADPAAVQYVDTTLSPDTTYNYYIKAYDTSTNASEASNTVSATAEFKLVDVTFRVTVPAGTPPTVFVAGGFPAPYAAWNPGSISFTQTSATVWEVTLQILDGTQIQYKYTRGSWDTVEKGADGNFEINNRQVTVSYGLTGTQLVENTVENWRDPFVIAYAPGSESAATTTISATWNQSMNEGSVENAAGFTVTGAVTGAINGALHYDDTARTVTFTPNAPLPADTYTVLVSGRQDAGGDWQQVPTSWQFNVVSAPGQATAIAPLGTINAAPTSYSFNAVAGATWYQLWIDSPTTSYAEWYEASTICAGAVCTIPTPALSYTAGWYTWWIQAFGAGGYGEWSSAFDFTLALTPNTVQPLTPNSTITDTSPDFQWNDDATADWYYLWLHNFQTGFVMSQWYEADVVCTAGVCTVTPPLNLPTGWYTWWLQTYNNVGTYGAWSNGVNFTVNGGVNPPVPTAPLAPTTDTTPDFVFNAATGATWYYLWLTNGTTNTRVTDQWFNAATVCPGAGTVCVVNPGVPLTGGHTFRYWLMSWSPIAGYSVWSSEYNFSVIAPAAPEEVTPETPVDTPVEVVIPDPAQPVDAVTPVDEPAPESGE